MFRVPTVKQCCCFDVRFGSLVIACLELAYAVVGLLDGVRLAAVNVGPSVLTIEATTASPDGDSDDFPAFVLRDKSVVKRLARMYFWFHLAETIGMLVIASLLVHGIRTKRRSLFMPWLGIHFLTTVIFGVLVIVVPLGAVAEFGNQMAGAGAAAGIACLIAFVINAYITTVVYSHYRELGAEARARHQLARPMEVEVYLAEQLPPSYEEIVKNKEAYPPVAVSTNP